MKSIISIHDVMPKTLDRVLKIIQWLETLEVPPSTLLVVPGKNWSADQIKQLDFLSNKGYTLAAHGWHHKTKPRRIYHRLHALILSRDVAEHLDLSSGQILELLDRSKAWFLEHKLPAPPLYVPPAWALGPIRKKALQKAPYDQIETTRGLIRLTQGEQPTFKAFPLTGYEADTQFRAFFLSHWNRLQENKAKQSKVPLRISIHPDDLELKISKQLEAQVKATDQFLKYSDC